MKSKNFLLASIFMFCISLITPVYISLDQSSTNMIKYEDLMGFQALVLGWMTFPFIDFFCWLANFALLASWFLYRKSYAIYISITAIVLAFLFSLNHYLQLNYFQLSEYHLVLFGYWFWLISMILQLITIRLYDKELKSQNN